jgi:hypothetical protein
MWRIAMAATMLNKPSDKPWYTYSYLLDGSVAENTSTQKYCLKGKAIRVTGRRDPLGCEASRLTHFLDNRLTESGEMSDSLKIYQNSWKWI